MEEDLQAARELQRVLFPDASPEIQGLEAAVRLRPAREISGDIYDLFEHHDGQAVIAFGDVSGKGAAAALYGGLMSGLLRTLAPRRRRPAELLRALERSPGGAQGGSALRHPVRPALGPRDAPSGEAPTPAPRRP